MSDTITVTYMTGVKELKPVKYWITEKDVDVRKWYSPWRSTRTEYYLNSEFMSVGPFDSAAQIMMHARASGMNIEHA